MPNQLLAGQTFVNSGTVYARVWDTADLWCNVATLEAFNATHMSGYAIAANQDGTTGRWTASMPALPGTVAVPVTYFFCFFQQAGGAPAQGDTPISEVGSIDWNGTAPVPPASVNGSGQVIIDATEAIPTTGNVANSIADCLNAGRAQGFGKWAITGGTTLTLYAPDGVTAVRTFTLDAAEPNTQSRT